MKSAFIFLSMRALSLLFLRMGEEREIDVSKNHRAYRWHLEKPAFLYAQGGDLISLSCKIINLSKAPNSTRDRLLVGDTIDVILYSQIHRACQAPEQITFCSLAKRKIYFLILFRAENCVLI